MQTATRPLQLRQAGKLHHNKKADAGPFCSSVEAHVPPDSKSLAGDGLFLMGSSHFDKVELDRVLLRFYSIDVIKFRAGFAGGTQRI